MANERTASGAISRREFLQLAVDTSIVLSVAVPLDSIASNRKARVVTTSLNVRVIDADVLIPSDVRIDRTLISRFKRRGMQEGEVVVRQPIITRTHSWGEREELVFQSRDGSFASVVLSPDIESRLWPIPKNPEHAEEQRRKGGFSGDIRDHITDVRLSSTTNVKALSQERFPTVYQIVPGSSRPEPIAYEHSPKR